MEDHDAITTLVADFRNMKEGLDKFHLEMRASIKDIKDNYTERINDHETRINSLETAKTRQTVLLSVGIGILTLLVSLMIYHIMGSQVH